MIDRMEKKISDFINSIMEKDSIDFCDYQILVGEINRQHAKEHEEKMKAENKAQQEQWLKTLTSMVAAKGN